VRLRSRARGQSVVEFGILALVFVLMLGGIVEFGLMLNGWVSVTSTTREAARWAATGLKLACTRDDITGQCTDPDGVFEKVLHGQSPPGVPSSQLKIRISYSNSADADTWECPAQPPPPAPPVYMPLTTPFPACVTGPGGPYIPQSFPTTANPPVPVGTTVFVELVADTYEVITPLVRPAFCGFGSVGPCHVKLASRNSMYFEGIR
jgi:TadE-like protein